VELVVVLPVALLLLFAGIEGGFLFSERMGLQFATREGARVGAGLASGTRDNVTWPTACHEVDTELVAAVERTMRDSGSLVDVRDVREIRIFRARADGTPDPGTTNRWAYTGAGTGPVVDGTALSFTPPAVEAWSACSRSNGATPDAIGVAVTYAYTPMTPAGQAFGAVAGVITIVDQTVFVLNP
jgi:hypothetical protein